MTRISISFSSGKTPIPTCPSSSKPRQNTPLFASIPSRAPWDQRDTANNAVVRSISLPRIAFSSIITKDGLWLLANSESGKLFVVDLASGAVAKTFDTPDVPVLPTPGEFALAPDGIHAYVTCPQGGTIEVLNLKDSKMQEPIRLTKGVDGMAWVPSASD
jgi:DNA-binding beta-propeller fold protein YncE